MHSSSWTYKFGRHKTNKKYEKQTLIESPALKQNYDALSQDSAIKKNSNIYNNPQPQTIIPI